MKSNQNLSESVGDNDTGVGGYRSSAPVVAVVAAVALFLAVVALHWRKIDSAELLLQLKAGLTILQTGAIADTDIFSAASRPGPWVHFEWLWSLALAGIYQLQDWDWKNVSWEWAGLNVVSVLLAFLAYMVTIARGKLAGAGLLEAVVTTILVAAAILPGFYADPSGASVLLFALALLFMESRRRWPMIFFPLIVALWTNVHVGVAVAFVFPVMRLLMPYRERLEPQKTEKRSYLAVVVIAALLCTLINPHSVGIYRAYAEVAVHAVQDVRYQLGESLTNGWFLMRLALAGVLFGIAAVSRRLNRREIIVTSILTIAAAFFAGVVDYLLLYVAAPAARGLSVLLGGAWNTRVVRGLAAASMLIVTVAFSAAVLLVTRLTPDAIGAGIRPNVFPETAAGRLSALPLRAAVLNKPEHGGFLVWRLWPDWKVTADGRPGLYPRKFKEEYEKLWQGGKGWEAYMSLWRVQAVVGDTKLTELYPEHNLYHDLAVADDWVAVYWDRDSILYVRKEIDLSASNLEPFRQLKPGLPWNQQEALIQSTEQWRELAADLRRTLMEDPGNAVAQEFLHRAEQKL